MSTSILYCKKCFYISFFLTNTGCRCGRTSW